MSGYLSLHIIHASVTNFDGICVANFVKRMCCWKGLSYDGQEPFSYVGLYILAKGWVKPGYFPISILGSGGSIPGIGIKFKFVIILTSLQSSLIRWNGCGKNFFICRDLRKPIFYGFG